MIIKKIAKMCRERKTLLSTYFRGTTLWVGTYSALYALNGLPDMTGAQIAVMFDFSDKLQKDINYTNADILDLPISQEFAGEIRLDEPDEVIVSGSEVKVFRYGERILFCDADLFEPMKDLNENVGLFYYLRKWRGSDIIAVHSGLELVALIMPRLMQLDSMKDWCDKQRQLIVDIESYVAQIALEQTEEADENQMTIEGRDE
ncbi:MAG: hypothetical protein J6A19_05020 [Oscillospiraceae bacterium]|nr:hypothetical protein [Oscillospiraceae bacterium]